MNEITINGITYVPKAEIAELDGMKYCIIRTYSAGVHVGYVKERDGKEVTLVNARRLWKWAGAFTLSDMAVNGVSKPNECKFSTTVPEVVLTEAIEIIPCTATAQKSLQEVRDYNVDE